ncbi:MAG: FAD-binding oxidoreductase [Candidatus Binatia bacterium]
MNRIADALSKVLPAARVHTDAESLAAHRTDYWILSHLRARQGRLDAGPACVVRPESAAEVASALRAAGELGVAVVPYGAGSGVLGGATPPAGALVIDLRAMDRLLDLNETALWVRVQAGMMGNVYEAALHQRGYTGGHFPQSIDLSTVGGWVATRAAGQFSTRYGNIEDLLLGLEAVLPDGTTVRIDPRPRSSTGPSLRELFLGSEGTFGVVTEVVLRIFPTPERREVASFAFATVRDGLEAIRRVVRVGWRPPVVRLYDATEATRQFSQWVPEGQALLLVVSEGPSALVAGEMAAVAQAAAALGAHPCGAEPVAHWIEHRNTVPSWDFFLDREIVVDTIEVAADWDRVGDLYERVVASLQQVPGLIVGSAHSSHSYPQGTNLYITFAVKPADWAHAEESYLDAWGHVLQTTLECGGTIAHHHGIGRLRTPWLERELRSAYPLLRTLKAALDPAGIMNPGVLLPPRPAASPA